jgi:hypothetical protein
MQRILFIILLFTGYIYSQQVQPLVADTNSSGAYDVNYIKILGTKNDATHHRLPVDINGGTINATITGGATSANQALLKTVDSLIQINTKKLADSIITRIHMNSATLPFYSAGVPQAEQVPDSMISAQTKTYQFNGALMAMVTIYNPSATTPDTVSQALWNYAKKGYSTNAVALISLNTIDDGQVESDPTTVIIPPLTSRKWLIDGYNIWGYQITWKTPAGKTSANKFYISYSFVR